MEDVCSLPHIPQRLHTNGRPDIPCFVVGEKLYRRCPPEQKEDPFATISLLDLSVNREGPTAATPLCEPEDVLRNFSPYKPGEWVTDEVGVLLVVRELVQHLGTYKYTISIVNNKIPNNTAADVCVMQLTHHTTACNYAHCAFKLTWNGEEVTFSNYKQTLGHKQNRDFRDKIRYELSQMMELGEIWLPLQQALPEQSDEASGKETD